VVARRGLLRHHSIGRLNRHQLALDGVRCHRQPHVGALHLGEKAAQTGIGACHIERKSPQHVI
jgi:hypothetical protein